MKTTYLPHLAGRVFGTPLLIQPQKLGIILHAIGPRLGLGEDDVEIDLGVPVAGTPLEDATGLERKPYSVEDGIAVIGVSGTLVKRASWMDAESGLQSYDAIRAQLRDAVADPRIKGILLDVDSPGGEVGGLFDLCDEIVAARSRKPVYAVANDSAFSAAYAIASSADKIFVTKTGGVGSIGVIAVHMDQSGFDEKVGRKFTAIYAGARKNDFSTHAPLTDEARASLQTEIDRLYEMFVRTVANNRSINAALVRSTEAGVFYGEKSHSVGLADFVGTFDQALAAVQEAATERQRLRVTASAEAQIPKMEGSMNEEQKAVQADAGNDTPAADAPAPVGEQAAASVPGDVEEAAPVVDTASIEARLRAEYEEIAALCTLAGNPAFAVQAIADKMTAAQVRDRLLAERAAQSSATAVNNQQQAAPANAEAQLNAAAEQIAAERKIPFAQAYVEALSRNPKLYQQYLAEKSAVKN